MLGQQGSCVSESSVCAGVKRVKFSNTGASGLDGPLAGKGSADGPLVSPLYAATPRPKPAVALTSPQESPGEYQGSGTLPSGRGNACQGQGRGKKRPFRRRSDRSFLTRKQGPCVMVSARKPFLARERGERPSRLAPSWRSISALAAVATRQVPETILPRLSQVCFRRRLQAAKKEAEVLPGGASAPLPSVPLRKAFWHPGSDRGRRQDLVGTGERLTPRIDSKLAGDAMPRGLLMAREAWRGGQVLPRRSWRQLFMQRKGILERRQRRLRAARILSPPLKRRNKGRPLFAGQGGIGPPWHFSMRLFH